MKLVLDTDVVVAAIRSPSGASAELLRRLRAGRFQPVVSVPLVLEYEAVATRPAHLAAAGLTEEEVGVVLDVIIDLAIWTRIHFAYRPATADPADEFVLEAAVNAGADAIVTFNRRDFGDGPSRFGIACLLPREALERLS